MQVKYDSFDRFEVPKLTLCLPGSTYVDGRINGAIGILSHTSDEEIVANFNELSSLNFVIYKVPLDSDPDDNYSSIKNNMTIFVDGIGFFIITNVEETISSDNTYKSVSAESCEREIENKTIPADFYSQESDIDNTYNATYNFTTLLEMLVSNLPLWVIDHIDNSLSSKYRTFEDVSEDTNILSFLLNNMQDAYECIFSFDTVNRVINAYDQNNYVRETSIHLTNDDIVNSIQIDKSSDEIYTAINVLGDNDITISGINPTGSNVIYNFDYYLDTMPASLATKVSNWQNLVDSYLSDYYTLNTSYYDALGDQKNDSYEVSRIKGLIDLYKKCKDNIVAAANFTDASDICHTTSGEDSDRVITVASEFNSSGTEIVVRETYSEELSISSNGAVLTYAPSDNLIRVFVKDANGIYIKELTQSATASTDHFVYNASNHSLSFKSGQFANNTKIGVFYKTEAPGVENDVVIITGLVAEIEAAIDELNDELVQAESDASASTQLVNNLKTQVDAIRNTVNMDSYFTQSELEQLSLYIFEGSYRDSYVVITDSMTYPEQLEQMKILYDRAKQQLDRISTPTEQFTVDVENFIFQKKFEKWANELETGVVINVELYPNDIAQLFLSNFTVNYEDHQLTMTFGNRFKKYDTKSLFNELLGGINRTANSLNFVKEILYPIRQGEFDLIKETLANIRMLSAGQALTSQNQDFIIDSTGITGRQSNGDDDYYPEQLKIVNNMIALTDDGWETCKLAIGKLLLGDGTYRYGVNAEVLIGDLIIGNELHILGRDDQGNTYDMISAMNGEIRLRATKTELASVQSIAENAESNASAAASSASTAASNASASAAAAASAQAAAEDVQTRANNGEFDGADGATITSSEVKYQKGTSGTTQPTGTWETSIPSVGQGEYLWTRTVVTYSDGHSTTSYAVSRNAVNGSSGTSPTVTGSTTAYQQSANGSEPPTGTWSPTAPEAIEGQYLWTRTTITYSDGATAISYGVSRNGSSPTSYSLIVSHAAIVKSTNGSYSPSAITLTGKSQTGTNALANYPGRFKIETTTNNSTWTSQYTSSSNESTKSYTIPANIVAVRCSLYAAGGTTTLLDQQVIPIVTDGTNGAPGEPAYTIVLTNESHTFAGSTTAAIAGSAECQIIAYKGATQVAATIGTITGAPTGMSTSISNNGTTSAKFTVSVTTSMVTKNGVLTVPVTVDGKSFEKQFTYSLSFNGTNGTNGAPGEPAYTVILTNESNTFAGGTSAAVAASVESQVIAYKGATQVAATIGTISGAPAGMSTSISNNGTTSAKFTVSVTTSMTTRSGTLTIPVTVDGKNFEKKFTYSLSLNGKDGTNGTNGTSPTAYNLIVSHAAVCKTKSGTYSPAAITLSAKSQTGNAAIGDYAGRFKIETTTNNSTWTAQYTSSSNESSKSYTIPNSIVAIRCSLYAAGGTTTLLDQQVVPIVTDGTDGTNGTNGTNGRDGVDGTSPTAYSLILSHAAIGKNKSGVYNPTSITLTAKSQTGNAAVGNYPGRFKIETTTNNSTWTSQYTSSSDESTKSYTIPANIVAVRCSLYAAGGTTTLLDQHTIPVVTDGIDGTNGTNGTNGKDAKWFFGTALTHTSGTATATVSGAIVGSMYLNPETASVYSCTAVSGTSSTWTYAGNIADGVMSNIDIGGRNLLLGTQNFSGDNSISHSIRIHAAAISDGYYDGCLVKTCEFPSTSSSSYIDICTSSGMAEILKSDTDFILSFWAKASEDVSIISYLYNPNGVTYRRNSAGVSINNSGDSNISTSITTEWNRYWIIFRPINRTAATLPNNLIVCRLMTKGVSVSLAGVKFEAGNMATDWTPAPEDLYTTIESNFEVLDEKISSKVSSETYYNGYDELKEYADAAADDAENNANKALEDYKKYITNKNYSTIEQTSEKIESAVSASERTLRGEINTVSSSISQTAQSVAISVLNEDQRLTYLEVGDDGFYIGSDNATVKIRQTAGSATETGRIQFVEVGSGAVLGEFTINGLITSQVETDDQVVYRSGSVGKWATRKGATVNGKVNLNDVWIGG